MTTKRQPKCEICGARIEASLIEVEGATGWLCLECSGASLDDFTDGEDYNRDVSGDFYG